MKVEVKNEPISEEAEPQVVAEETSTGKAKSVLTTEQRLIMSESSNNW